MKNPVKKRSAAAKNEARWAWAFILPTMLGLIILNFYPVIDTVYQSFCKTGDFGKGNIWVGLDNYKTVLANTQSMATQHVLPPIPHHNLTSDSIHSSAP